MGRIGPPKPVRRLVGAIFADTAALDLALDRLGVELGTARQIGEEMDFDAFTDYYAAEMGPGLKRRFYVLPGLAAPEDLVELKRATNALEDDLAVGGGRRVNLDPGILSASRVALASTKDAPQRLYLGQGIYAELTLVYHTGEFHPLHWTYPDYASTEVRGWLADARRDYLAELREVRP